MTNLPETYDLKAEIDQSAADKLIMSVSYPFQLFETTKQFPGCIKSDGRNSNSMHVFSHEEIKTLLKDSLSNVRRGKFSDTDVTVSEQVYSFCGSIIEQAKKVIDAEKVAGADYEGPDIAELKKILDGGIEELPQNLGDFALYGWNSYLRIVVRIIPAIVLQSPRINLSQVKVEVTATGELWAKYPWWNCYKWCTKWEKITKCEKIANITVSPTIAAEAHALCYATTTQVFLQASFDKLRLDYEIIREIPLEGLANDQLKDRLLFVYDARQLIATVPVLQSRFSIESIFLPESVDGIGVQIKLRQI